MLEASYVNIPTIALAGSDSPLEFIDIPIPCNNRTTESISIIYWLLAREVLILRGELDHGIAKHNISIDQDWDVFVDLFYYREISNEQLQEEQGAVEQEEKEEEQPEAKTQENW